MAVLSPRRKRRERARPGVGEGGVLMCYLPLSLLTIDLTSISRRSTVPPASGDTSNAWVLIAFLPYMT